MTKDQSRDTGMALTLLGLIAWLSLRSTWLIYAAIALHVVNMVAPKVYRFAAVVWLGLSELLGAAVSRVVLSLVFFIVVMPVGIVRRMRGKDSLRLREFKRGTASVFFDRHHTYRAADLERPY